VDLGAVKKEIKELEGVRGELLFAEIDMMMRRMMRPEAPGTPGKRMMKRGEGKPEVRPMMMTK